MDVNPVTPGHALVVPRVHVTDLLDVPAWQTVVHFHVHVIPRFKDQPGKDAIGLPWHSVPGDLDEIEHIGNELS